MSLPHKPLENGAHANSPLRSPSHDEEPPRRKRGRPRKHPQPEGAAASPAPQVNGKPRRGRPPKHAAQPEVPAICHSDINATEIQDKLRQFVRLAKEQDYLTFDDINESLPEGFVTPDLLDEIITRLRGLEIHIIQSTDVDRVESRAHLRAGR